MNFDLVLVRVSHLPRTTAALPRLIIASRDGDSILFVEFFAAAIRNPHTRRAYGHPVSEFLAWCEAHGVQSLAAVQPLHVATWIEARTRELSTPTVKQ